MSVSENNQTDEYFAMSGTGKKSEQPKGILQSKTSEEKKLMIKLCFYGKTD